MASNPTKKKPIGRMIAAGAITIALYIALLANQETVNDMFSRGGLYALLPIAAAFLFSITHGEFTGSFWSVLGIEAAKKRKETK